MSLSNTNPRDVPTRLSLKDVDHLLAVVEWALNHRCGGVNEATLDEYIAPGLNRAGIEEVGRKIEQVGELQRHNLIDPEGSTIIGLIQPPHPTYTGKCPCGCGIEFEKGVQLDWEGKPLV